MQTIEYYTEVLPDGHIPLPQIDKKRLCLSKGKKIKVILLSEWIDELTEEGKDSKIWDRLEELGARITQAWKETKSGWQLVSEGRR